MSVSEFSLIEKYFSQQRSSRDDVLSGIGDDGAITHVPENMRLITTVDSLVEGCHFTSDTSPYDVGFKAVAVNLSDIAAMGGEPCWATLALTLPQADTKWLSEFSKGLFTLLNKYRVQLIGGDTTRGPLTITIQINGLVPEGKALARHSARPGDLIYVTGSLGDAGLGLLVSEGKRHLGQQHADYVSEKFLRPVPRIEQGIVLRDIATAAIDVSDGLLSDLGHILDASQVGAKIIVDHLPLSDAVTHALTHAPTHALKTETVETNSWDLVLSSGEDYELCFTVPANKRSKLEEVMAQFTCPVTCIGEIQIERELQCVLSTGEKVQPARSGYDHFGS